MDNQNLMPHQAQPISRISSGQLPTELTELTEEALSQLGTDASSASLRASSNTPYGNTRRCSYDGDDAE